MKKNGTKFSKHTYNFLITEPKFKRNEDIFLNYTFTKIFVKMISRKKCTIFFQIRLYIPISSVSSSQSQSVVDTTNYTFDPSLTPFRTARNEVLELQTHNGWVLNEQQNMWTMRKWWLFWTTETCVKTSVHIFHGVAVEKVLELNRYPWSNLRNMIICLEVFFEKNKYLCIWNYDSFPFLGIQFYENRNSIF